MKASSSDRGSSKSRSTKSIKFSSKNRTEIVEILGLRPNLAKNASERVMGVLPDVSGVPPSEPAAPQERPGRALGAPQNVLRASGSAPEAFSERPRSAPNRPKSMPRGPTAILHRFVVDLGSILGSIFDGFCIEFLFAWPFVCLLLRSSARSTVAVHLRFSCVLRACEPHRQSTIPN